METNPNRWVAQNVGVVVQWMGVQCTFDRSHNLNIWVAQNLIDGWHEMWVLVLTTSMLRMSHCKIDFWLHPRKDSPNESAAG